MSRWRCLVVAGILVLSLSGRAAPARGAPDVPADAIAAWNRLAHDIAFAEDQFLTFKGQRGLAMMQLAMHDALNAVEPVYDRFAYVGRAARDAHPVAAAAQAAHDVLASQYPAQRTALDVQLVRSLAQVPDGERRGAGLAVGRESAAAILARRQGDGWDRQGTYAFGEGPGRYQTTPPWNGFVAQPGFRLAAPFVLAYPHQFRPSPPPPLRSRAGACAASTVKAGLGLAGTT